MATFTHIKLEDTTLRRMGKFSKKTRNGQTFMSIKFSNATVGPVTKQDNNNSITAVTRSQAVIMHNNTNSTLSQAVIRPNNNTGTQSSLSQNSIIAAAVQQSNSITAAAIKASLNPSRSMQVQIQGICCQSCNFQATDLSLLERHFKLTHKIESLLSIKECFIPLAHVNQFTTPHLENQENNNDIDMDDPKEGHDLNLKFCSHCEKSFMNGRSLKFHIKSAHTKSSKRLFLYKMPHFTR